MQNRYTRVLKMTAEQWAALDQLATDYDCREPHGKGHRLFVAKWTVLIRRLASGELVLHEPNPYILPAGLAEQADAVLEQQRERERIAEQQRRVQIGSPLGAVAKQAVRKTPVKLVQMDMLTELEPA